MRQKLPLRKNLYVLKTDTMLMLISKCPKLYKPTLHHVLTLRAGTSRGKVGTGSQKPRVTSGRPVVVRGSAYLGRLHHLLVLASSILEPYLHLQKAYRNLQRCCSKPSLLEQLRNITRTSTLRFAFNCYSASHLLSKQNAMPCRCTASYLYLQNQPSRFFSRPKTSRVRVYARLIKKQYPFNIFADPGGALS